MKEINPLNICVTFTIDVGAASHGSAALRNPGLNTQRHLPPCWAKPKHLVVWDNLCSMQTRFFA